MHPKLYLLILQESLSSEFSDHLGLASHYPVQLLHRPEPLSASGEVFDNFFDIVPPRSPTWSLVSFSLCLI